MEVSRLSFEKTTLNNLNDPFLTRKRANELRIQRLKDIILTQPNGVILTLKSLVKPLNLKSDKSVWQFLNTAEKNGLIRKEKTGSGTKKSANRFYWVDNVKVTKPKDVFEPIPEPLPEPDLSTFGALEPLAIREPQYTDLSWIENEARQFAWLENSDSLRLFVDYINKKERQQDGRN